MYEKNKNKMVKKTRKGNHCEDYYKITQQGTKIIKNKRKQETKKPPSYKTKSEDRTENKQQ